MKYLSDLGFWILKHTISRDISYSAIGDFEENYSYLLEKDGPFRANVWFWSQVLKSIPLFILDRICWSVVMLSNYLKIVFRNIKRQKIYSIINISGLSIGLLTCILMLLYVNDELNYDKFHTKGDNIYRIVRDLDYGEYKGKYATSFAPFSSVLLNDYSGIVKKAVRFFKYDAVIRVGTQKEIQEKQLFFTDPEIFEVFSFVLISGDKNTALSAPFSIVITKNAARKYFGETDPIGKVLTFENKYDFKVTGILDDPEGNSHIKFDCLVSFSSLKSILGRDISVKDYSSVWYPPLYTYLLIPDKRKVKDIEENLPDFAAKMYGSWAKSFMTFKLQPLHSIHFKSHLEDEMEPNSDMIYVYVVSTIACFVLIIACINFINLSTARSSIRAKEVGVRKVLGAQKKQLVRQFITETIAFVVLSIIIALILAAFILPAFNDFTGKNISLKFLNSIEIGIGFLILIAITGLTTGFYPALFLSSFKPVKVLKTGNFLLNENSLLRKTFIAAQFIITIVIIIGTFIIRDQMAYIESKNLGLNKNNIVVISVKSREVFNNYESIRNELEKQSNIINVSLASQLPFLDNLQEYVYRTPQIPNTEFPTMVMLSVEYDFIRTMGMELVDGRDFNKKITSDKMNSYIINESAAKKLGWENPVGKEFGRDPLKYQYAGIIKLGKIIGVVKNFHFSSMHNNIDPVAMFIHPHLTIPYKYFVVKTGSDNLQNTINNLRNAWLKLAPNRPFEYMLLDDGFERQYVSEQRLGNTFYYFSFFSIFISCLGLFGLISFIVEQRAKEVGIRKVFGASISNVVFLFLKEFIGLVILSNIIAWPLAFFVSKKWLEQFAYKINIDIGNFLTAFVLILIFAVLTVSFQTIKAGLSNPAETLKYE